MNINIYDYLNNTQKKRIKNYTKINREDILILERGMKICSFNPKNFQFKYVGTLVNYDDTFLIITNMKNYNRVIPIDEFIFFYKK